MKYRYARVTRKFVLFFCVFSLFVVCVNIVGLYRYGYISIPNFLLALSSFAGTLLTTVYIASGYKQFNLEGHKKRVMELKNYEKNQLPEIDVFLPCS